MFQKIAKHRANDASNDVHRPPLIVMHKSMFNHTSTSFPIINKNTLVSQCAYCKGLQALPGHALMLGYFWPKDMSPRFITPPIKLIWSKQQIPVCWIHVATEGYYAVPYLVLFEWADSRFLSSFLGLPYTLQTKFSAPGS